MPRLQPLFLVPVLAGCLTLLTLSCGGGKQGDKVAPTPTPELGAEALSKLREFLESTSIPGARSGSAATALAGLLQATPPARQVPSASPAPASAQELQSFRFDVTLKLGGAAAPSAAPKSGDLGELLRTAGDLKMEGAFVAPDAADIKMTVAGQDIRYIQVGGKAWANGGSGWQPTQPDFDWNKALTSSSSGRGALGQPTSTQQETVNGVKATHYSYELDGLAKALGALGSPAGAAAGGGHLDLWLTAEQLPVKAVFDSGDGSIYAEINIRDINSRSIQVKPPV